MTKLKPVYVDNVRLPGNAFLAPMAGITDQPFRALAEEFAAGMVVSEMIASANLGTGQKEMIRKLSHAGTLPHVVQIAGNEEKWMTLGVRIAQDAGAEIIDINMGCPSKKVTNGYAGSALMRVPDRALRLIEAVAKISTVPVTLKMRLGWNDKNLNAPEIAKMAENAGVKMLAVHGRTRQQFYKGVARWKPVRDVVEAVKIPVIVNGDIVDAHSARVALKQSGAAGVMIGRGAQGQPWVVGQISADLSAAPARKTPTGQALVDLIKGHYHSMLATYGTDLGVRIARKHLRWYLTAAKIDLGTLERKALLTQKNPDLVLSHMSRFLLRPSDHNLIGAA